MHIYALKIASAGMKENLGISRKLSALLFNVQLPCEAYPSTADRPAIRYGLDLKV